jgi:hypothetical protein
MTVVNANARSEAAALIRRVAEALPRPVGMALYLHGVADGLERKTPARRPK